MINRQSVGFYVEDEGGIAFDVEKTNSGSLSVMVRVFGEININGEKYVYDQNVRIKLKKDKDE